jgi:hypothetical protein
MPVRQWNYQALNRAKKLFQMTHLIKRITNENETNWGKIYAKVSE